MIITINFDSEQPIYEQLRNQIIIGIGSGQLTSGSRLPTVRQLAEDLGINAMTVNKAYMLLKNEGYIMIDRRHGAKVNPHPTLDESYKERLEEELRLVISEASIQGIRQDEFFDLCRALFGNIQISTR